MTDLAQDNPQGPSIRLGIGTCLLGERVRYDGGHKLDRFLVHTLGLYVEWVPVCPEVEMGLPTPREPIHLEGDPQDPCLVSIKSREGLAVRCESNSGTIVEQKSRIGCVRCDHWAERSAKA